MPDINHYIEKKARESGICEPWAEKILQAQSVDDLLELYLSGIDFCLSNNFPSNKDLLRLGGEKLKEFGIFIDSNISSANTPHTVLLGASKAQLTADRYSVYQIFLKNTSQAEIVVKDHAFVVIDCFDFTHLNISSFGKSKALVNVYGQAQVHHFSVDDSYIKVVHKHKRTY